ncbi:hypothetical protein BATDEDRAFT_92466 [Batrachochytrium dendrobatidis JAM81]|uniref:Tubulin/FtsZ GTPase domain-containing protein n=1 Tax=Batrachochytrium dendrobatidis (strain JAM81 / FGSC 10211) TaxID=684364 RepID=F4PDG5_BATDJ|nr:uncharacterized protein BATDEDRAFT_92466 [Batrachochytrium dendrobatidis JAM81]EGF76672.1 hypothetical protein BATDEDRAFT_92466 [Batrachochytrium dendrobatidis JAM81]|eukprot:XP_006682682.1 hypothetical protein BATDEDRAFT_92466 [Batrachochytrium dendrobatidis JAM81]
MDTCIKAMLHLISSIPPRYIKYNKVLSAQIDTAMKQVHHLQVSLTHLQSNISSTHSSVHHKPLPVTLDIQTTFTQYRIMQVLFEVWKSVGRRYAPHVRTFNVSNVVTLHNVDTAEHYLNRLCSWRRMIDTHTWKTLTLGMTQQEQQLYFKSPVAELPFSQRSKLRILGPPALPSGLYPQAWEYLVKPPSTHIINAISSNIHHTKPSDLTTKSVLREFRQLFMNALLKHELYTDYELNILLDQLLCLHGSMYTHHDGESTQPANRFDKDQFDAVEYPYALIRDSICKEFNMGWTTAKDGLNPLKTDLPSLPNAANKQLSQNDRDMDKTIQQIGGRFWDLALQEHAKYNTQGVYDDCMSSFFRNVDEKKGLECISVGKGNGSIRGLKARGIMIDMEEGVINHILRGPLQEIFDPWQHITSVSGSGNNWAMGHHVYGPQYRDQILEVVRKQAEYCNSLQSFFIIGSMGGGTGSGLGSYLFGLLEDAFPSVYRFASTVIPSPNDDVVTSPYNSVLSLHKMAQSVDCVLPVDNQSLLAIYERIQAQSEIGPQGRRKGSAITDSDALAHTGLIKTPISKKADAFDTMNNLVANLLLNMTSSMRFEGMLNVDINDIVTNLIPFPKLKYLFSTMTPLYALTDVQIQPRRLDQMFTDAFSQNCQLISADPRSSVYLASALIVRGAVEISDLRRNIDRMQKILKFVPWNTDGWKTGMCSVPPLGQASQTCLQPDLHSMTTNM